MASADRLIEIFNEAKSRPVGTERDGFLAKSCGEDAELKAQVLSLLGAHEGAGEFLKAGPALSPEIEAELARLKPEEAGERIGPYKLREQIGEGGFGVVWVAEQQEPVRRTVALKIIKMGMDTREVVARFEQEKQALAMMDHPHIAKVFDAGATQYGRPFFVMELVRGIKITDYCDQANLPTAERLALFMQVCHAVQHAHQKGIIHRDLKPSNILVTLHDGVAVPKVIDFGVAKATQQQRLTDLTIYTQLQQMIGTPIYMSPEQAQMSGLDIDTRSDIYSLGVLLYELLTGRTPFDPQELMKQGLDEIRRTIREQEPQTPSMFVGTLALDARLSVAQHRQTDAAKLVGLIRGDLDWIVMKALEKDRARRYDTANGFARDIQRHLENEPVLASPPSQLYRFRRFVRRNKVAFAAGTAVVFAVLLGAGISTWQGLRAKAALAELRENAPVFAADAHGLMVKGQIAEAIERFVYASKLRPDVLEYRLKEADLLQSIQRFSEAAGVYRTVLKTDPGHARAQTDLKLCEEFDAETAGGAKLSPASLKKLLSVMEQEHRSSAELWQVLRYLGNDEQYDFVKRRAGAGEEYFPPDKSYFANEQAPELSSEAHKLTSKGQIAEAIEPLGSAIKLRPDVAAYKLEQANLLESIQRFAEAARVYRTLLETDPGHARAKTNLQLCSDLDAEMAGGSKLSLASLKRLLLVMQQEDRSSVELWQVGRYLGKDEQLALIHWLHDAKKNVYPPDRSYFAK